IYTAAIALNAGIWLSAIAVRDDMHPSFANHGYYSLKLTESNAVTFPPGVFRVGEGDGAAIITVVRYGPATPPASIDFATGFSAGAAPGVDFVPTNGTLVFPAGSVRQSFAVTLLANDFVDPEKSVWLELSNPTNVYLGELTSAMLIIEDDDL